MSSHITAPHCICAKACLLIAAACWFAPPTAAQASDIEAPDIWRRLPYQALETALEHVNDAPHFAWDVKGALRTMSQAAAEHSLLLGRETDQLRGEVKELQATVGNLQGTVAALGAQVQALLQQSGMQKG
jgi:hypothetical protein